MVIEEQERTYVEVSIRVEEHKFQGNEALLRRKESPAELYSTDLLGGAPLFAHIAPASFAERFPRLTFCAVATAILLATLTAEVECLRSSGYFWR